MFSIAALVPAAPILVPELGGGARHPRDVELSDLREAVLSAAKSLAAVADRWVVVGADRAEGEFGSETVGTFRGFGVDLRVGLSAEAVSDVRAADPGLPLSVLIGAWLRGQVAPSGNAWASIVAHDASAARCGEHGARLRARLDEDSGATGVLVVADGAATLSASAPGYLDERASAVQDTLDQALGAGDLAAVGALDPGLCAEVMVSGRAAHQVLAGLFDTDPTVETLYRGAPFGVGYHVGLWRPSGAGASAGAA
ncbi:class III extradiol ring-cleavage dioxygenase family protein [Nocardia callitridis]|uniref:Uncharacterized protein n=1 Tax=Nocardia callitridis TaxID=648753 RepID=A0ABP9KBW4_9NOCA